MANQQHVNILLQDVDAWNQWRKQNPQVNPDLSKADLYRANLRAANLSEANISETDLSWANLAKADLAEADLTEADLTEANLSEADLTGADIAGANLIGANLRWANLAKADLSRADLYRASLRWANLSGVDLTKADLYRADLSRADLSSAKLFYTYLTGANLSGTNLSGANMEGAILVEADLSEATLTNCRVYGISAWGVKLATIKDQSNLRITPYDEPEVTVDNLEVAQLIYLLLHNEKIKSVVDILGKKGILILGRFTKERMAILEAIRNKLREHGFVPMMFDFEKPAQRDFTETIKTLAGMSRFIIADITNPKSSPLTLEAAMPDDMIPVVPIIHKGEEPFSMFQDFQNRHNKWVLDLLQYDSIDSLLEGMEKAVIGPALKMSDEFLLEKAEEIRKRHVLDYL